MHSRRSSFAEVRPHRLERYLASKGWRLVGAFSDIERYWANPDQDDASDIVVPLRDSSAVQQLKLWYDVRQIADMEARTFEDVISDIAESGRYRLIFDFERPILRPERLTAAANLASAFVRAVDVLAAYDPASTFSVQRPGASAVIDSGRLVRRQLLVLYDDAQSNRSLLRTCFEQLWRALGREGAADTLNLPSYRALRDSRLAEAFAGVSSAAIGRASFRAVAPTPLVDETVGELTMESAHVLEGLSVAAAETGLAIETDFRFGGYVSALRRRRGDELNVVTLKSDSALPGWKTAVVHLGDELYARAIMAHAQNRKVAGIGTAEYRGARLHIVDVRNLDLLP